MILLYLSVMQFNLLNEGHNTTKRFWGESQVPNEYSVDYVI